MMVTDTVRGFWPIALLAWLVVGTIAVSPITVACLTALVLLVAASCRGIAGIERRVILFVIVVAVLSRALVILGLLATSDPDQTVSFPFEADGRFLKQRALWVRSLWLGVPLTADELGWTFQSYGWTSYIYVVGYLQYLFGPAPYAIHFLNTCCFVGGMVMLHRIVRQAFGPLPGIIVLVVTLFLPTLFMWSISALKESVYFLLFSAALLSTLRMVRGSTPHERITAAVGLVVAVAALDSVRGGALVIAVAAGAIALAGAFVTRHRFVLALALVLAPLVAWALIRPPSVQERLFAEVRLAAYRHVGHVRTTGNGYKLLDQRFYSGDSLASMTGSEARRFVVRAALSVVIVPLPWQLASRSELLFLPQQLIWYCLVLLALFGAVEGVRRDGFVTWCLIGVSCAGAAAVASSSGNIGTMVRHRDAVVPFVVCLSAVGAVSLLRRAGLFHDDAHAVCQRAVDDVLVHIGKGSLFIAAAGRTLAFVHHAWEQTAMARTLTAVARIHPGDLLRLSGALLFLGMLGHIALSPGERAWPIVFVRLVSLLCAVGLAGGGRQLASAWEERTRATATG